MQLSTLPNPALPRVVKGTQCASIRPLAYALFAVKRNSVQGNGEKPAVCPSRLPPEGLVGVTLSLKTVSQTGVPRSITKGEVLLRHMWGKYRLISML
jgi:hypothetical protein